MYLLALKYIIIGTGIIFWLAVIIAFGFLIAAMTISQLAELRINRETAGKEKLEYQKTISELQRELEKREKELKQ